MSLGLPFRLRSCMCYRHTIACMSLSIYQLLNRAYCPPAQEDLTDYSSKKRI
ncbi:hypothetical protein F383_29198 [Gossypium arboreum]|uniref:Uncharacterized protein n=1 Tax=Gossypium arboreum TaxID=29729 RepID=A0A0B0PFU7_GOSAR|nr:hypothetical protein F383_29490 [Gossypium arboreum]KHG23314.1 hypothetical protein F383_29198 [Gossypium arboreum]